jgi:hypothetical protein
VIDPRGALKSEAKQAEAVVAKPGG